jgi:hypothetical protein
VDSQREAPTPGGGPTSMPSRSPSAITSDPCSSIGRRQSRAAAVGVWRGEHVEGGVFRVAGGVREMDRASHHSPMPAVVGGGM